MKHNIFDVFSLTWHALLVLIETKEFISPKNIVTIGNNIVFNKDLIYRGPFGPTNLFKLKYSITFKLLSIFSSPEWNSGWAYSILFCPSSVHPQLLKQLLLWNQLFKFDGTSQMILRWSSTKFAKRIPFHAELWLPWQPKGKSLKSSCQKV